MRPSPGGRWWQPDPVDDAHSPPISIEAAVSLLSEVTGERYHVIRPLTDGETGATEIEDATGERYVFKREVDPDNRARRHEGARLADRLRVEANWPSPEQRLVDTEACLLI